VGAWGFRTFEDDTTCDWIWELTDASEPLLFLKESLRIDGSEDYLEYDQGASLLAASETVYALAFGLREDPPEDFQTWVASNGSLEVSNLFPHCIEGLRRLTSQNSELNELWAENDELYPKWKANIQQMVDAFSSS
jgi:hypothetical protein